MLSYFPSLYEGELLYSWLARYHVHTANVSPKQTMNELFGKESTISVPDLPSNLEELFKRLTGFQIPDTEYLIKNHTFYRFYATFASEGTRTGVIEAMKQDEYKSLHTILGIVASTIKENSCFMYCPKCFEEMESEGERYWKLEHQLPGMILCLEHKAVLLKSFVKFRTDNKHEFVAADFYDIKAEEVNRVLSREAFLHAFEIGKQIRNLITTDYVFTLEGIQSAYKNLLIRNGFMSVKGHVKQKLLSEKFLNFYGEDLLYLMQSSINVEGSSCWLKSITRKHRKLFHPIRHLLLINFLGETLDTFYSYSVNEKGPFGAKPYYCLNPAADHYKQRVISNVSISRCSCTKKPVGTFNCECGFVYSRRGPDRISEDQYKIGRIKQFGPVWHAKLQSLFYNEKKTYKEISKILKCDRETVKKYLMNHKADASKEKDVALLDKTAKKDEWLHMLGKYPDKTVTEIRKLNASLYMWLYRNEKEWLKSNSPKIYKLRNMKNRVDWNCRDDALLEEVFNTIYRLYHMEKPVHVNISRIGKEIGKLHYLEKYLDKLPKTKEYLLRNVESIEQFQIRRIQWAAKLLLNKKDYLAEWEIKRLAGLKESISDEVKEVIKSFVSTNMSNRDRSFELGEN